MQNATQNAAYSKIWACRCHQKRPIVLSRPRIIILCECQFAVSEQPFIACVIVPEPAGAIYHGCSYFCDSLFSWSSSSSHYILAKLASGIAESLQNLRSRETTWLWLCNLFVRCYHMEAWKKGMTLCWSGRRVTCMTVALFSLDHVLTNLCSLLICKPTMRSPSSRWRSDSRLARHLSLLAELRMVGHWQKVGHWGQEDVRRPAWSDQKCHSTVE